MQMTEIENSTESKQQLLELLVVLVSNILSEIAFESSAAYFYAKVKLDSFLNVHSELSCLLVACTAD